MRKPNNIYIAPEIKEEAEMVLNQLGMTAAEAITIFLNQVVLYWGSSFFHTITCS